MIEFLSMAGRIVPGKMEREDIRYFLWTMQRSRKKDEAACADFKIGVILRQARESAGLTQEDMARKLSAQKSSLSRVENHADDVRLSILRRYADAVGASLQILLAY